MKPSKHIEPDGHMVDNHGHQEWRTDWPVDTNPPVKTESYQAVELRRRRDGWTAERQRLFLSVLAQTGSIAHAAEAADITPRSAYRLRNHPKGAAFAAAMDKALLTGAKRLLAVALERAVTGTPRQVWRGGRLVASMSIPSDRMLMFLLRNLMPDLFGRGGDPAGRAAAVAGLQAGFGEALAALTDTDVDADLLDIDDYRDHPPHDLQA